ERHLGAAAAQLAEQLDAQAQRALRVIRRVPLVGGQRPDGALHRRRHLGHGVVSSPTSCRNASSRRRRGPADVTSTPAPTSAFTAEARGVPFSSACTAPVPTSTERTPSSAPSTSA